MGAKAAKARAARAKRERSSEGAETRRDFMRRKEAADREAERTGENEVGERRVWSGERPIPERARATFVSESGEG